LFPCSQYLSQHLNQTPQSNTSIKHLNQTPQPNTSIKHLYQHLSQHLSAVILSEARRSRAQSKDPMRVGDANGPWKFSATAERTLT
jgi:hypothetical protein